MSARTCLTTILVSLLALAPVGVAAASGAGPGALAAAVAAPDAPGAAPGGALIPEPRLVEVPLGGTLTLERLLREGLDVVDVRGEESATLLEWPEDAARLAALGASVRVLDEHPGLTQAIAARAERGLIPPLKRARPEARRGGQPALTAPPFGSGSMGGYWTAAEIKMKLDDLVAGDVNDIVADKIDTVGTSIEGRPIWGLEIGKHVTGPDTRPVVFFNALTHAREPAGMQSLLYFVDDIVSRYGSDPFATYLLDHRRLYIVPLVNPDGYHVNENVYFTMSGFGLWRKNTRDNNNNGTFDGAGDGVDINRNYGFQWGYDTIGSSINPSDETYRGTGPFSEPETQVQRDVVAALHPVTGLSFHSYNDLMLHPWGYTSSTPTLDEAAFHEWDDQLTRYNAYQSGVSGPLLYLVNGEFNDWCYGDTLTKPRAFTWTPEVGTSTDQFWPPLSRALLLAQENAWPCYFVAAIAGAFIQEDGWSIGEGALRIGHAAHLSVRARNLGAGATGAGLTGTLTPLDPGVHMYQNAVSYPALASRTSGDATGGAAFEMVIDDTVTAGRLERFRIDFTDADGLFSRDTLAVPLGVPTVLAADDASSFAQWTVVGTWGVVTNDTRHPSAYFADSPSGHYPAGADYPLTLTAPLDLSPGVHAYAVFDTRWDFERDADAGLVEASLNGSSWTLVGSRGSTQGSGIGVQFQTTKPYYAGTRWNWRTEWADLSGFTGPAGSAARFRFRLRSDGGSNYDGIAFDSIRVLLYDPAAQPPPVAVSLGPAAERLELSTPAPNPARRSARVEYSVPERAAVRLDVLDVQGRLVRPLFAGTVPPGRYARLWDLADDAGRRAPAGVYFLRLVTPARSLTRRFVVLGE